MPKEILTLYTKLLVNRGSADEELIDLLSTPDLGIGDPEKVEVTNLQDGTRRYVNGLKDVGDSLEFEFNYVTNNYQVLKEIEESKEIYTYKVVLPDKLCFKFDAALSVKITGAAVGEQVKMTINLTPYSTIDVGPYEDNAGQQGRYSTFTIGQSRARSAGILNLVNTSSSSIEELYINNVAQELPTGVTDYETDDRPAVITNYEVNPGDVVRIKGGFSLWETELPINNVVLQNDLKSCRMMFYGCTGLTETPIIPEGVENCSFMFDGCTGLTEAPTIPSSVTNCMGMFLECTNLAAAPVIPSSVTDCTMMFQGCTNLTVIPEENMNLINNPPAGLITQDCFAGCTQIADQIPTSWGGNKVEYTTFTVGAGVLKVHDAKELYIDGVQQSEPTGEFGVIDGQKIKIKGNFKLEESTIGSIDNMILQNGLTSMESMFRDCSNLTSLDLSNFDTSNVTNMCSMFNSCNSLTTLNLSNFDTSNVTNYTNMLQNIPSEIEIKIDSCKFIHTEEQLGWDGTFTDVHNTIH